MITFESFTLSTNIAGNCEAKTNNPGQGTCGYYFEGVGNVFLSGMGACVDFEVSYDDGQFNSLCYHVPYGQNVFNS